jgi:general stress protein 26
MDANEARAKLWSLIKEIKFAMLVTESEDGALRSRPMATQQNEFDGTLWFFTAVDSPKVSEIRHHQKVNLSYAEPDDQKYVSVSGTCEVVRDRARMEELWNPVYKAWFPRGLDEPNVGLLKVDVTGAEYWDSPSGKMVHLIGYAKAIATGERYQASEGEHKKLNVK